MEKIELQLDQKTLETAIALAKLSHCDLSKLVAYAIDQLALVEAKKDQLRGLFADEPDSVDEMLEEVMKDRVAHPLLMSPDNYQKLINRLNELEDMLLGKTAETALSQSKMVGTENFTSALECLANAEA
ncbi:prevent-host-death protein [Anabaena sp. UHCC 0399]|uniref:prevent-host-death protein n=1 Tax=Anabaena sp. UHCC 0399 TaxID=3110238 RepID=UPI002B20B3F6|nr:prevent-host-death protein [Anabaena sp. UHCC 0399]MEA5564741.1 prevent-host-death protein [Anabaena sp. UHCC 0399]